VDDETPLGPLAEMHNIIEPKPDRNLGYPLMYPFMVTAAYAPYFGYLKISGQWGRITGEYPYGLSDPVAALKVMTWIAHFVTVLLGVTVVLAAFGTGLVLKNRLMGILAALFAMTSYPMFYYSRTGNVDVPMLCFASLTIMMLARCLTMGLTLRRAIWMGVFGGFALGTKEQVFGMFLVIPVALIVLCCRQHACRWRSLEFWRAPIAASIASFVAFGIGSGLFVEPSRYLAHVEFYRERLGVIARGEIFVSYVFPFGWEGNVAYILHVFELLQQMITLPGILLAVGGVLFLLTKRATVVWFAAIAIVYFVFIFFTLRSPQIRYVMPFAFLLAFPAAWLVASAWECRKKVVRWGAMVIAVAVIGFGLLRGAGLTYEMLKDSRYQAAKWFAERAVPGDVVEYFGPEDKLPPLEADLVSRTATEWRSIYFDYPKNGATAQSILNGLGERRPQFIIIMPDVSSSPGLEHSNSCPPGVFEKLQEGVHGYVLAAEFRTPPLFSWFDLPALDYPSVNPPIRVFSLPR
jgi:hypothetical protein